MSTTKRTMQEAKRLIGGQMLLDGHDVSEVADALNVSRTSVYRWQSRLATDGLAGLHRKGKSGRTSLLSEDEKSQLKTIIQQGAVAYGQFLCNTANEQWTSKRVRLVIFERFHVEYNSNYVCEILKSLNFSQQVPQVHSVKRNQAAIDHWKRYVFPQIKKNSESRKRS